MEESYHGLLLLYVGNRTRVLFAAITEAYGITGTANEFQSELENTSYFVDENDDFLLVKCINQITRKKNYLTIENKLFTVLLTLPVATIIILCVYTIRIFLYRCKSYHDSYWSSIAVNDEYLYICSL